MRKLITIALVVMGTTHLRSQTVIEAETPIHQPTVTKLIEHLELAQRNNEVMFYLLAPYGESARYFEGRISAYATALRFLETLAREPPQIANQKAKSVCTLCAPPPPTGEMVLRKGPASYRGIPQKYGD